AGVLAGMLATLYLMSDKAEKGVKGIEQPFIHPTLYLAYQTTPVLPSVFNYLDKKEKPTFRQIPDITNEIVIHHLENICRRYQRQYKNGELELFTCDLQFKAQKLAVRGILAKILKKFTEYSVYTLEQVKENDRHFRFITNEKQKDLVIEKISKYH
ncbi:13205_t:CDS:2, partial [Gigaspora margarita]